MNRLMRAVPAFVLAMLVLTCAACVARVAGGWPPLASAETTGEVSDLGSVWHLAAPGANTNIFATNIQLKAAARNVAVLRIQANLAVSGPLSIVETDGTTTIVSPLLAGTTLNAGQPYALSYEARAKTPSGATISYNFQIANNGIVNHVRVTECDGSGN